jgi:hypothetical protein
VILVGKFFFQAKRIIFRKSDSKLDKSGVGIFQAAINKRDVIRFDDVIWLLGTLGHLFTFRYFGHVFIHKTLLK